MEAITSAELTETGRKMIAVADAYDDLARELRDAESIADDVPALSELFHAARTSRRNSRDGRYVALLDYDGEWTCTDVSWLQSGSYYKNANATLTLSASPKPFCSVDEFAREIADTLNMKAQAQRQNATLHRAEPKADY